MNTFTRSLLTVAVVFLGCVGTFLPAQAEDAPPARTVQLADLDLSTPEGVREMEGRLGVAARRVCNSMLPGETNLTLGKCQKRLRHAMQPDVDRHIAAAKAKAADRHIAETK